MSELGEAYQSQIGARLLNIAWQPMTCDTPGVVTDIRLPCLSFSGAASLHFDTGQAVSLTWKNANWCFLTLAESGSWQPFALDLIHCSGEDPWADLINAKLLTVELFRDSLSSNNVVAARHAFETQRGVSCLWVGVGTDGQMLESDDLLILLGREPTNRDELALLETIGAQ